MLTWLYGTVSPSRTNARQDDAFPYLWDSVIYGTKLLFGDLETKRTEVCLEGVECANVLLVTDAQDVLKNNKLYCVDFL